MLCRMLIIIFLVFAFAQPYLPLKGVTQAAGTRAMSVFIDNSFSMNALCPEGTLLDDAKNKAVQLAKSLSQADKIQLVTEDFSQVQERWLNRDEFIEEVKGLTISPFTRLLGSVIQRQQDNLEHSGCPVKEAFIISDFQKSVSDISIIKASPGISVRFIPEVTKNINNLSVDSCWFDSPVHQPEKSENLNVKIINYGAEKIENSPIKLYLNGDEKSSSSFTVSPFSQVIVSMSFVPSHESIQQGMVKINDYPIIFDDELYFSFRLSSSIPVLWIHPDSLKADVYCKKIFGSDSLFQFNDCPYNHIDYSSLSQYRLTICDCIPELTSGISKELENYLANGGNLLIVPPVAGMDYASYATFLSSVGCNYYKGIDTGKLKVNTVNFESRIYSDVFINKQHSNIDLPKVSKHYTTTHAGNLSYENIMRLENGDDFLTVYHYKKGTIYLLSVPLDKSFTNFQDHAMIVPTFYNIGLYSASNPPLYTILGTEHPIEAPALALPENVFFRIKSNNSKDTLSLLPERRVINSTTYLFLHNQITDAGNYRLLAGDSLLSGLSFNYNRIESDMRRLTAAELDSLGEHSGITTFAVVNGASETLPVLLKESETGKYLWFYCIVLSLLFLAAEEIILRVWKD